MIQELFVYIDFHNRPFTIDISDYQTPIHAIYVCGNENDIKQSLPLALDYYKKLYSNYLKNKQNEQISKNGKQPISKR